MRGDVGLDGAPTSSLGIAERLVRDGFTVVINYAGSATPAEALLAKIEKAAGRAITADGAWINGQVLRVNGGTT